MVSRLCQLLTIFAVMTAGSKLSAQIIDAGGPRDVFYGGGTGAAFGIEGLSVKLDTATPSLQGIYLHPFYPDTSDHLFVAGADLRFATINGIQNITAAWPETDLTGIFGYVRELGQGFLSLTLRDTPFFSQDPLYDASRPSGQRQYTKDAFGDTVVLTGSYTLPPGMSWLTLIVSGGFSATNNYNQLQKASIGSILVTNGAQSVASSGTTVRFGTFHQYNAFPLTFMTPITFAAMSNPFMTNVNTRFSQGLDAFFSLFGAEKGSYYHLILAPYISYTPRDLGRPINSVGLNFVIRSKSPSTGTYSFPVSLCVDRANTLFGKPSTTFAAAFIYKL